MASLVVTTKKLAAKKLAVKKKPIIVDSSSKESDGYLSSAESDGYLSSKESDAKLSVPPQARGGLFEYEIRVQELIAWNKAQEAKKKLSSSVNRLQSTHPEENFLKEA